MTLRFRAELLQLCCAMGRPWAALSGVTGAQCLQLRGAALGSLLAKAPVLAHPDTTQMLPWWLGALMKGTVNSQAVESSWAAPRQQLELLRYGVNVSISAHGRRNKNGCNGILKACKAGILKREKLQQKTAHEQPPQSSLLVQNMPV